MQGARKNSGIAIVLLMLCSCASTTYFKEADKNRPHGVLQFQVEDSASGTLLRLPQVYPLKINGLPPNHWAKMNIRRFNVLPGDMRLLLQAPLAERPVAICSLEFKVEPDRIYSFQAVNVDDSTTIRVLDAEDSEIAACESKRQYFPQNKTVPLILPFPI